MLARLRPAARITLALLGLGVAAGGLESVAHAGPPDSGFGAAIKQSAGVNNKTISGFTNGTVWRVRVRGYKYKTQFEWSDWVEFRVDQS